MAAMSSSGPSGLDQSRSKRAVTQSSSDGVADRTMGSDGDEDLDQAPLEIIRQAESFIQDMFIKICL